jgi:hypothetical protein
MMLRAYVPSFPLLPSHVPFSVLLSVRNAISKNPLNKKYFSLPNHNNQHENNYFKPKIFQFYHETVPMV